MYDRKNICMDMKLSYTFIHMQQITEKRVADEIKTDERLLIESKQIQEWDASLRSTGRRQTKMKMSNQAACDPENHPSRGRTY